MSREDERINLTQVEAFLERDGPESGGRFVYNLIAELKRCYEEIDRLHDREINTLREMHRLKHSPK